MNFNFLTFKIKDEFLLILFSRCPSLVNLSLKRNAQCAPQILIYLIHNLTRLRTLSLSGSGFDSLGSFNLDDVRFDRLEQLTTLDLSMSNGDNKVLANILRNCKLLSDLDVSNCIKLTDEMFTLTPAIGARLEQLNLSMNRHVCGAFFFFFFLYFFKFQIKIFNFLIFTDYRFEFGEASPGV